jgi:hypothetical protein
MTHPLLDFVVGTMVGVALAAVWLWLAITVEEWSYAKKQPAPGNAADAADSDAVGAGVVRTRPRRVSLSPWIK